MSKAKTEIQEKEYYKYIHFLYEIFNSLKNVEEIKIFLKDMLTSSELRMIKRRWHIANFLVQGLDIRTIADKTRTSTQTVSRVKQVLEEGHGGLQLAIERMGEQLRIQEKQFLKKFEKKGGSKYVKGWFK